MLSKAARNELRERHADIPAGGEPENNIPDHQAPCGVDELRELLDTCDYLEAVAKSEYRRGYTEGVTLYAWWKDGVQYVGCGMRTLKEALEDVE